MKIALTGSHGFLGSYVAERLLERGMEVRGLQHCASKNVSKRSLEIGNMETVYGDIRNPETCLELCEGVDSVIHLAAAIHVDESRNIPREYFEHNVGGTFNLMEGVRMNGLKKITYISTFERFGNVVEVANEHTECNPSSPYSASKVSAEMYVKGYGLAYGIPYMIPIGANMYGPRQRFDAKGAAIALFCRAALRGDQLKMFGEGKQTRDYTYVDDVAEGVVDCHLSRAKNELVCLCSGEDRSMIDIAQRVIELTGSKSEIVHLPPRPGENMRSVGNSLKAFNLLGWKPRVSFNEGLKKTVDYYKQIMNG